MDERFRGKQLIVVGFGITGRHAAALFKSWGANVSVYDDNPKIDPGSFNLVSREELRQLHSNFYFKSPGVSADHPVIRQLEKTRIECLSELDLFQLEIADQPAVVIGVTGTNGKSTVVDALGFVLKELGRDVFVGGNIGRPMLEACSEPRHDFYVLELSSYQLEDIRHFRPDIGVLLNIAPDHLDRYRTVNDYLDTKLNLFRYQRYEQMALCGDGLRGKLPVGEIDSRVLYFSPDNVREDFCFDFDQDCFFAKPLNRSTVCDLKRFRDECFILENLAALLSISAVLKLNLDDVVRVLHQYRRLPHRMAPVGEINGRRFINDSKATNIHAVEQAIRLLLAQTKGTIHVLIGGRPKEGGFNRFFERYRGKPLRFYLFGELEHSLHTELGREMELLSNVQSGGSMETALGRAFLESEPGDVIVLSPACASFDAFKNYKERGKSFAEEVNKLHAHS